MRHKALRGRQTYVEGWLDRENHRKNTLVPCEFGHIGDVNPRLDDATAVGHVHRCNFRRGGQDGRWVERCSTLRGFGSTRCEVDVNLHSPVCMCDRQITLRLRLLGKRGVNGAALGLLEREMFSH